MPVGVPDFASESVSLLVFAFVAHETATARLRLRRPVAACSSGPSDLEQSTVTSGTTQQSKQALCTVVPDAYPMRHPVRFPLLPAAFPVVQCPAR
jgi:hypothetical protein